MMVLGLGRRRHSGGCRGRTDLPAANLYHEGNVFVEEVLSM